MYVILYFLAFPPKRVVTDQFIARRCLLKIRVAIVSREVNQPGHPRAENTYNISKQNTDFIQNPNSDIYELWCAAREPSWV